MFSREAIRRFLRRASRPGRLLLVLVAALGLLPIGDVPIALGAVSDHEHELAADPWDDDCGGGCAEHGCTPLDHHCRCCSAMPVLPSSVRTVPLGRPAGDVARAFDDRGASTWATPPPTPPPTV